MLRPSWNRVHAVRSILDQRSRSAYAAAKRAEANDGDERFTASLRGKGRAYKEAADLVRKLERGGTFRRRNEEKHL